MKKYKVRAIGTEFLQEVEIAADSKDAAEKEYREVQRDNQI